MYVCTVQFTISTRETYEEKGDPARPPAQLAGRWGQKNLKQCTAKEKIFYIGPTRAAKTEQKSFVLARQAQEPTKEKLLSFVLLEFFTSVSTGTTPL